MNNTDLSPSPSGTVGRLRDKALLRGAEPVFRRAGLSALGVRLPSGVDGVLGTGARPNASLQLRSFWPLWRSYRRGPLGFAESYLRGEIETDDLAKLIGYFLDNYESLVSAGRIGFDATAADRSWHQSRDNTRDGSRRNIAAHYDLGNEFYVQWLDAGMTYSSALNTGEATSLEQAQDAKYALTLEALDLREGHKLVEIGCGWGGMAERAARTGAEVAALTISAEQLAYARRRIAATGLQPRTDIRFQDYRELAGSFDRLVSIEMIEAVGERHWPEYFAVIARNLKQGGVAVLQAITIREEDFALYRSRPDFIQRYIFPGGMLPTVALIKEHAEHAGLGFEPVKTFGTSYAWTLAQWRQRFADAWPQITKLGFDERFRRMWEYYFLYCEVGFERAVVDVGTYRLCKRA